MSEDEVIDEISLALLNKLASLKAPDIEPGEITASMLAEKTGRNQGNVKVMLDRMVDDGKLSRRFVTYKGKKTAAYREVSQMEITISQKGI